MSRQDNCELELRVDADGWKQIHNLAETINNSFNAALESVSIACKEISATIVLSDESAVALLNRQWRGKEKSTNILSFPAPKDEKSETGRRYLGDIILAYEVVNKEALQQGKALETHLCHLVIHGALHLLGYDHLNDKQACIMEDLERTAMKTLGLADPYLSGEERQAIKTEV